MLPLCPGTVQIARIHLATCQMSINITTTQSCTNPCIRQESKNAIRLKDQRDLGMMNWTFSRNRSSMKILYMKINIEHSIIRLSLTLLLDGTKVRMSSTMSGVADTTPTIMMTNYIDISHKRPQRERTAEDILILTMTDITTSHPSLNIAGAVLTRTKSKVTNIPRSNQRGRRLKLLLLLSGSLSNPPSNS